jgi:hypothetical protein
MILADLKNMVNIVKDKDIYTFLLLCFAGIEAFYGETKYSVMAGIAALLCRVIFKTTENGRKSKKFYKSWRKQILSRQNNDGIEFSLDCKAFQFYFPDSKYEQYPKTLDLLIADKELEIKVNDLGMPYYIGTP